MELEFDKMDYREKGKKALELVFQNPNNANIIERYIHNITKSEEDYVTIVYETIGIYIKTGKKDGLESLLKSLYQNKIGWDHTFWDEYRHKRDEVESFLTTPFEVEEGVLECGKCGSNRTISYQKQLRSADEGSSTISQCATCKNRWIHHN